MICLLTVCIICSASCRKDEVMVKGQWRWSATYAGGIAGGVIVPDANSVVTLSLDADLSYTTYLNNGKMNQGKYSVTEQDNVSTIHFDKDISTDKLIIKQNEVISYPGKDSLTLSDGYVEGASHNFIKVN